MGGSTTRRGFLSTFGARVAWRRIALGITAALLLLTGPVQGAEPAKLIAHWPLGRDARDAVGALHGTANNVEFGGEGRPAARFNGRDSVIQIPDAELLHLGDRDFSLALWVKCETPMRNTPGDLVSKFDARRRRGWNFYLAGNSSMGNAPADTRHVHFGIDDGYLGEWHDHGKPWASNSLISALVVFNGDLYCGIADADRA